VLSDSTVKAALVFAAGKSAAAGSAAALAEGVLQAMFMDRVKWGLAVVLVLGLAGAGAGVLAFGGRQAEGPVAPKKAETKPKADVLKADQLRRLAAARLDAAKTAYEGYWARYEFGRGPEEAVHLWSRRWLQAQLDLSATKADRDAALASYQERLKKTDEMARARLVLGNSPEFGFKLLEGIAPLAPKIPNPEIARFENVWKAYQESNASEEEVCLASVRWLMYQHLFRRLDKELDPKAELQAHLDRVKAVEAIAEARFDAGKTALPDYKTATFFRLQAEEWLAQGRTFEEKDVDPRASSK
jgi:hypothetical protein